MVCHFFIIEGAVPMKLFRLYAVGSKETINKPWRLVLPSDENVKSNRCLIATIAASKSGIIKFLSLAVSNGD